MKKREINIIYNKNGNGNITNKITLPVPWLKKMGFTEQDRRAVLEFNQDTISISKKEKEEETSAELFRKQRYRQRYNSNSVVIYKLKDKSNVAPTKIIIHKSNKEIEFMTDKIEDYIWLGDFSFSISAELWKAINKKIEETK